MTNASTAETEELFKRGLEIRREVLGKEYVDASLAAANDFNMAFQRITTEWCWGYGWGRGGLDRKIRSLINLAMLTALNRPAEIKLHVRGALKMAAPSRKSKRCCCKRRSIAASPQVLRASARPTKC
jgi:4-carboxymuconolactone decarboxylase